MTFDVNFSALFFSVLMFFSLSTAHADPSVTYDGAEIAVFTPWTFLQKSLQGELAAATSAQQNLGDIVLNVDGLNWNLTNVQWKLDADLAPGQLAPGTYDVKSNRLNMTLSVDRLSLNQTVDQVVGGVLIHVQIQATCNPITLTQTSAQADAQIGFQVSSTDISTQVNHFDLSWPAGSWQVSPLNCQGPSGFNQNLAIALNQQLASADLFKSQIQNLLAQRIQSQVETSLAKLKSPTALPVQQSTTPLQVTFKTMQTVSGGLLNFGTLVWNGKSDGDNLRPIEITDIPSGFSSDVPVLLTRQNALTDLIKAQLSARQTWTYLDLKKQSSFLEVLNSRFLQIFVWPDLWNFQTASPFLLAVGKPDQLVMNWKVDGSADATFALTAWVQSMRGGQWWQYIKLAGNGSAHLTPSIKDGQLSLAAKASTSNLTTTFGTDYVTKFHPLTRLGTSQLQNAFNSAGQSLAATATIPTLDLGPAGTATANGWSAISNTGLISVPFKIQAVATSSGK